MKIKLTTKSEEETVDLGRKLAMLLKAGDIVGLNGELGSGKTTFIKGVAQGLKVKKGTVHSPTFVFMNMYEGTLPLFHFDLYRLERLDQIYGLGYEEFLFGPGVALIEWVERMEHLKPKEYLDIRLSHKSPTERTIEITAAGDRYKTILNKLK